MFTNQIEHQHNINISDATLTKIIEHLRHDTYSNNTMHTTLSIDSARENQFQKIKY